jgi:hypothetical protein
MAEEAVKGRFQKKPYPAMFTEEVMADPSKKAG